MKNVFYGKKSALVDGGYDLASLKSQLITDNFPVLFEPFFVNQIHSNRVLIIDEIAKISLNRSYEADAIVTNIKNLIIGVVTADCAPIILHDQTKAIIAVIHAGWRGARYDIIANTIKSMASLGSEVKNIEVIIGPTIRQQSYEVSKEFYDDFLSEKLINHNFFINSTKQGFWMFDLVGYIKEKLVDNGIKKITDQALDTYSHPELFFSYRRAFHLSNKELGRNFSLCCLS